MVLSWELAGQQRNTKISEETSECSNILVTNKFHYFSARTNPTLQFSGFAYATELCQEIAAILQILLHVLKLYNNFSI